MPSDSLQIARLLIASTTLVLLAAFSQLLQEVLPEDFTSKVIGFLDADTIEVLHNHRAERIHLNGIDHPEKGRAPGTTAVPPFPKGDHTCVPLAAGCHMQFSRPRRIRVRPSSRPIAYLPKTSTGMDERY